MEWEARAEALAATTTPRGSQWREPVASTPRHGFVPRWWEIASGDGLGVWELRDGESDPERWLEAAYSDLTLVTRVGPAHADHAKPDDHPDGRPTSSSTLPGLVVSMLRHAEIYEGADVLDVATGSGYSAALLAKRLGDRRVTSIDVDPYLVEAAAGRLADIGLYPRVMAVDATGPIPGDYDRIVSMVSVRPIPASWLSTLRHGGRLVTVITGTCLIVTATKVRNRRWAAVGRVEWDRAMFMSTRSGPDYPPGVSEMLGEIRDRAGESVSTGRYPLVRVSWNWELPSMLEILAPGVEHGFLEEADGVRTALMAHEDGSWARASARGDEPPVIHQGGPRRLWDILDGIRHTWLVEGALPLHGAQVLIAHDGSMVLSRGSWEGRIA
ncbi:methyltransferase domain-containing protein [Rhizohabitans arisaemae]|uniref:methyltransferase domain-containing protein n=1 Tax=Rhizohabitans arisaemae TaxID=2720610 RepID=UPI0024B25577|nr:methyltransferase domain-containing protein [Rhizohabitans arisaemae]